MTNREWLATLTDEDFAKYMRCVRDYDTTEPCNEAPKVNCDKHIARWLKAKHEEEK